MLRRNANWWGHINVRSLSVASQRQEERDACSADVALAARLPVIVCKGQRNGNRRCDCAGRDVWVRPHPIEPNAARTVTRSAAPLAANYVCALSYKGNRSSRRRGCIRCPTAACGLSCFGHNRVLSAAQALGGKNAVFVGHRTHDFLLAKFDDDFAGWLRGTFEIDDPAYKNPAVAKGDIAHMHGRLTNSGWRFDGSGKAKRVSGQRCLGQQ